MTLIIHLFTRRPVVHHTCFNTDLGLRLRQHPNHTAYNIRDNSIVRLAALGTLLCTTPYQHCCQNRGQWRYPNESVVPASQSGTFLFTSRLDQGGLGLQPRTNFQETYPGVDGVYKCQIPDKNGITQTLSAWIYSGPLCKFSALLHLCYKVAPKLNFLKGLFIYMIQCRCLRNPWVLY